MTLLSSLMLLLLCYASVLSMSLGRPVVPVKEIITIAGNFSLNGKFTNLAEYDISTGEWSNSNVPQLYVYGESAGVLWDTRVNRSTRPLPNSRGGAVDELLVVGAFDTVSQTSQMLYCSVGLWTGLSFDKAGEGLCPRGGGGSSDVLVRTAAFGESGDLFVGGHFASRVWDGSKFADLVDVAQFRGSSTSWLPLKGGPLSCSQGADQCSSRVNSLVWDTSSATLFIGGKFNRLGGREVSSGLCLWSERSGLVSFSKDLGSGLSLSGPAVGDGEATVLAWDLRSQSLFVAGSFSFAGGMACSSVAVWNRPSDQWTCLDSPAYSIATVTAMCLDSTLGTLYLAGWASFQAEWRGRDWSPYAISRIDVRGYVRHHTGVRHRGGRRLDTRHDTRRRRNGTSFAVLPEMLAEKSAPRILREQVQEDVVAKYNLQWDWLPGFSGGNGPIFSVVLGLNQFRGCLFISGAFNNGPPIVLWVPPGVSLQESPALRSITSGEHQGRGDCAQSACVFPVGSGVSIYGLITSVSQLRVPVSSLARDDPAPDLPGVPDTASSLYVLLMLSISVGICLGIFVTVRCMKSMYEVKEGEEETEDMYHDGSGKDLPRSRRQSVTLGTLSTGGNRSIDLKACYRRAMQARHLSTDEVFVTINPQEIELLTTIGEGSFGTVWSGVWRNNLVAVKEFGFAQAAIHGDSQQSESLVEEIIGEAGLMTCLRHPKILQLYGCSITPQAVWIVCELCDRGSLRMLLDDAHTPLTTSQKLSLCLDVADGMHYLHRGRRKPIIHRDLKSYNIFVMEHRGRGSGFTAKIGDWGSARAIALSESPRALTQGVGTACWLAPEAIKQSHFSEASDVYSFGIVLWEIYTRRRVHVKLTDSQIIARVANDQLRPEVPVYCPWGQLMQACWAESARSRPGFRRVVDSLHRTYSREREVLTQRTGKSTPGVPISGAEQEARSESGENRRRSYGCAGGGSDWHDDDGDSDESLAIGASF